MNLLSATKRYKLLTTCNEISKPEDNYALAKEGRPKENTYSSSIKHWKMQISPQCSL